MLREVVRKNTVSIFALKLFYVFAKALGMVFFTVTDRGILKYSHKSWIFSIAFWTICSSGYMFLLTYAYIEAFQTSNFIEGITFLQYSVKVIFIAAFIKFQLEHQNQFLECANRTVRTVIRITTITKEFGLCGPEFYSIVITRVISSALIFVTDAPNLKDILESKSPAFIVKNILGYMLVIGTLISLDVVCLVFLTASRMYCNLGKYMVNFGERIQRFEQSPSKFGRRKQLVHELCGELEKCSVIYSDIFKIITKFHAMLQLIILLNVNFILICVIRGIHVCFVNYMKFGKIMWFILAQRTVQFVNLLTLVLCVDLMVQGSKIPQHLDWESLGSQLDERWDKCVYQFLAQMRLEALKIDVYGLFPLNRELCLQVFSMMVGYLTILIQFSMMGYFNNGL